MARHRHLGIITATKNKNMADIVNLRRARKDKARRERDSEAQANRRRFGRTKAERAIDQDAEFKSLKDIVANAKRTPGTNYGTSGPARSRPLERDALVSAGSRHGAHVIEFQPLAMASIKTAKRGDRRPLTRSIGLPLRPPRRRSPTASVRR
jgi:hypothetical protein